MPEQFTRLTHSPFFRASCGCIGLDVGQDDYVLVTYCGRDHYENQIGVAKPNRKFVDEDNGKTYESLTPDETNKMLESIGQLVWRGYRYQEIQSLLQIPVEHQ